MKKVYFIMTLDRRSFLLRDGTFGSWTFSNTGRRFNSHGEAVAALEEAVKERMCEIVEVYVNG